MISFAVDFLFLYDNLVIDNESNKSKELQFIELI